MEWIDVDTRHRSAFRGVGAFRAGQNGCVGSDGTRRIACRTRRVGRAAVPCVALFAGSIMGIQTLLTANRRRLAVVALSLVLGAAAALAKPQTTTPAPDVSLKILNETVPPGGLAQVKLF